MTEIQLGKSEVGAVLDCLTTEMKRWLLPRIYESVTSRVIGSGTSLLKALLIISADQTGVKESQIVRHISARMHAPLAASFKAWYDSWRIAPEETFTARNGIPFLIYDYGKKDLAMSIFLDFIVQGKPGLAMTRKSSPAFENLRSPDIRVVHVQKQLGRLSARTGSPAQDVPFIRVVKNHLQVNGSSIVLVDCLDYLKAVNGFQAAFVALSQVADIVSDVKGILIVSVRPASFEEAELSLLESTMEVLGRRNRANSGSQSASAIPWGASPA